MLRQEEETKKEEENLFQNHSYDSNKLKTYIF